MFVIIAKCPEYDDRDGFCGFTSCIASPNVYETYALAYRLMPSGYDEDGQATEISYYVADASDTYRRPIHRPTNSAGFISDDEDIPF